MRTVPATSVSNDSGSRHDSLLMTPEVKTWLTDEAFWSDIEVRTLQYWVLGRLIPHNPRVFRFGGEIIRYKEPRVKESVTVRWLSRAGVAVNKKLKSEDMSYESL